MMNVKREYLRLMPPSERPLATYSEATMRVIELALRDLAGTLDTQTVAALRALAARGALGDVDAVVSALTAPGSADAD